jgi:hypothetical protein
MKYLLVMCFFIGGCTVSAQHGDDHTITWTPTANTDGYQLYCGNKSGGYSQNLNIAGGGTSSILLKKVGLADNVWFCVITSYNFVGSSEFSNEINFSIVGGDLLHQAPNAPTGLIIK